MTNAMDIETALEFADVWTKGHYFQEGVINQQVVCATLAAEVRRLNGKLLPQASIGVERCFAIKSVSTSVKAHDARPIQDWVSDIVRDHKRYTIVRLMNPRQFSDLWEAHLKSDKPFDAMVDDLIEKFEKERHAP